MKARAVIADDEPLLAQALARSLAQLWPELEIVGLARNGREALSLIRQSLPDIVWLDIRMPGLSGIEVVEALIEDWDSPAEPPLVVFVTAHDEFAPKAFEQAAIDYLLKPVNPARLAQSLSRVQTRLSERRTIPVRDEVASVPAIPPPDASADPATEAPAMSALIAQVQALWAERPGQPAGGRLKLIRASVGDSVHFVPVDRILYLQATDKYVNVVTADAEFLIREPLRELIPQLDPEDFVQIHRGTVVRLLEIARSTRDERGRVVVHLRHRAETLVVSRLHAHQFRPM